jgi:hypothetical protein
MAFATGAATPVKQNKTKNSTLEGELIASHQSENATETALVSALNTTGAAF